MTGRGVAGGAVESEAPGYEALRRRGIAHLQEVSGGIWTDYNVHDPGVALLEQVAFALTELAYRADLPVADLLAGAKGRLEFGRLGLATPLEALAGRAVTARDLELALASGEPALERVIVRPRSGAEAGLVDLDVVPAPGVAPEAALAAARRAFHGHRGLGEDIGALALAEVVACRLEAEVAIARDAVPERVAARLYAAALRLMRDGVTEAETAPVTRADVFEDPARLLGTGAGGQVAFLDLHVTVLGTLEGVAEIRSLAYRLADGSDAFAALAPGRHVRLALPEREEELGLRLVQGGLEVPFGLDAVRREAERLVAGARRVALDAGDWAEPVPARPRHFGHVSLAEGLPAAFGIGAAGPSRAARPGARAAAGRLRGYVALLDAPLADAGAGLEALGTLFAGGAGPEASYAARALALPGWVGRAAAPGAAAEAAAGVDPWDERRGRVLDHLLALQGEAVESAALRLFDVYRGTRAQANAALEVKARLLAELPALARARGAGPDLVAGQRCHEVGLGRRLTILLDFPDRKAPLGAPLVQAGLRPLPDRAPLGPWLVPRAGLAAPDDPLDMLVPQIEDVAAVAPAELVAGCAFLAGGEVGLDALRRGVEADAWVLAPEGEGWRLHFDPGAGAALFDCARFGDRAAAVARANAMRTLFVELNRCSEGVTLVEDVLLRGDGAPARPLGITVVLPGWTARTALPGFRRHAAETVERACPAHLDPRLVWLDPDGMAAFEALHRDWREARGAAGDGDAPGAEAGAALRDFLDARA